MKKEIVLEKDTPLETLAKLGKEKFKGKSIEQLKKKARTEIEENVEKQKI